MLIRHANDGKMYLYDILDVKKETSNFLSGGIKVTIHGLGGRS